MNWTSFGSLAAAFLVAILFLLSIIESSIARLSQVALKVLAEKEAREEIKILENISSDRSHYLLPLQFGIQVVQIAAAVLVTSLFLRSELTYPALWAIAVMLFIVSVFRQLLPKMVTQGDPERVLLRLLPVFRKAYQVLHWLSTPLLEVLRLFHASRIKNHRVAEEEEASEEEIQAYIGLGEEEGILEEDDTELIQSALEFGDTLVKEIMTPRNEIVAIEDTASVGELKKLMVSSKHSRIPVYHGQIDTIAGVVYLRNLLAYLEEGKETDPVGPLITKPLIVPDTKPVAELLKEMQKNAEHLAIVISEYGYVAGLVTLEDLVEEIVGEIRDEDELQKTDMVKEADGSYVVGGRFPISELEEALKVDLGDIDVVTSSGFVVAELGRVPAAGEKFELGPMQIEIVKSDHRRIHTLRIRKIEKSKEEVASH